MEYVAIGATILGLILTILNIYDKVTTNRQRVLQQGASHQATESDMQVLRQGNATILVKLDKMDSKIDNMNERLIRAEESIKSAHHRIDEMKELVEMGLRWVKKPKNKIEYSKRVVAIVLSFCIVVTIFAMVLMWVTKDTSPLAYLIPSVFAETGIVISFYLDKSKKENISKGAKKMKVNWKQKLSSRKFWVALVGFITPVLVIFNVPNLTIEQVTAIVTSCGALIAYILSEGYVDANRSDKSE